MDIDNLGMVEAEILQAPETRLTFFFSQAGSKTESHEEHIKCEDFFRKKGLFQGQLGVVRSPVLS